MSNMSVSMLRRMFRFVFLFAAAALTACAQSSARPGNLHDGTEITVVYPLKSYPFAGQNLLSFDIYQDQGVVHGLLAVATAKPKQSFILYVRSDDGGLTWSEPVEIGHFAKATVESGAGNDVQIAASGKALLAIWQITGELPGMGPLQAVYSLDGGKTWSPGANPTASDVDQSHPELVADQAGRFHLAWLDDRDENGHQGVRYARSSNAGRHWELAQTVDESSCSCCWNRLLMGAEQQVNLLYRDMEPRDMALAQSADAGKNWQRIATVGEFNWVFDGCPHNGGAMAVSDLRVLHSLVWTGLETKAGLYYLQSADNGKSWSQPLPMGGTALAFHSDMAVLADNRLLAIWDAMGPDGTIVAISELLDGGQRWSSARQISGAGVSATFPRIVSTPFGGLAAWAEQKPGAVKQWVIAVLNNNSNQ
ncbi:glycoside hydrolase [Methylomonas sp. SURF-2]|uniref:exo-alpha-sialidase n=1 Tax=Methylomonas subterranea TaxID=2952225 RepID=A0ABT1TGU2_9GAMM|nr:sialidase family protein [Methylomonas sp. SURF-2]MCQ8104476.1 glycoside hydrolase [Methylomonas sp. SURF-2]